MSTNSEYREDQIGKVLVLRGAIGTARRTMVNDVKFRLKMGVDWVQFVFRLAELETAVDLYEEALHAWMPPPPVIIASSTVAVPVSFNVVGAAVVLLGALFAAASAGVDVPAEVERARSTLDFRARRLRDVLPPDLARSFLVNDMIDVRVAIDVTIREAETATRKAVEDYMTSVKIDAGPMSDLLGVLGLNLPIAATNAILVAISRRIASLEPPGRPPPECGALRQEYVNALKAANNATMTRDIQILKRAWPRFTRAAYDYALCMLVRSNPPPPNPPPTPA